jgi:hypothetical protein
MSTSYENWKLTYFPYLLEMKNICANNILDKFPEYKERVNSIDFFESFAWTIYTGSSGYITKNLV